MNSTTLLRVRYLTQAAFLLLAALTAGCVAAGAPASWAYSHGTMTGNEGTVDVQIWLRGQDAIVRMTSGGALATDSRCIAGTLTDWTAGSVVVRHPRDAQRCFGWATETVLVAPGAPLTGAMAGYRQVPSPDKVVFIYEARASGGVTSRVTTDAKSGLILSEDLSDGRSVRASYDAIGANRGEPPVAPLAEGTTEVYTDLSTQEAARVLALPTLPSTLGEFVLSDAFSVQPALKADLTYYAVWTRPDGAEIQMVSSPVVPLAGSAGLGDLGWSLVFGIQEGPRFVQIYAPDRSLLASAFATLRPGASPGP